MKRFIRRLLTDFPKIDYNYISTKLMERCTPTAYEKIYSAIGYRDINAAKATTNKTPINVMSFNIEAWTFQKDRTWNETKGQRIIDAFNNDDNDFICLQEVDVNVDTFYINEIAEKYGIIHELRNDARADHVSILYKKDRFELIQEKMADYVLEHTDEFKGIIDKEELRGHNGHLIGSPRTVLMAIFKDKLNNDKTICIGNSHLYWNPCYDDLRYIQIIEMFNHTMAYARDYDKANNLTTKTPIVISGDMNTVEYTNIINVCYQTTPTMEGIQKECYLEEEHQRYSDYIEKYGKVTLENQLKAFELRDKEGLTEYGFENSYKVYNGKEGFPEFTLFDKYFPITTLDHIFYSNDFNLLKLRNLPTMQEMKDNGVDDCPNELFPSDH